MGTVAGGFEDAVECGLKRRLCFGLPVALTGENSRSLHCASPSFGRRSFGRDDRVGDGGDRVELRSTDSRGRLSPHSCFGSCPLSCPLPYPLSCSDYCRHQEVIVPALVLRLGTTCAWLGLPLGLAGLLLLRGLALWWRRRRDGLSLARLELWPGRLRPG